MTPFSGEDSEPEHGPQVGAECHCGVRAHAAGGSRGLLCCCPHFMPLLLGLAFHVLNSLLKKTLPLFCVWEKFLNR